MLFPALSGADLKCKFSPLLLLYVCDHMHKKGLLWLQFRRPECGVAQLENGVRAERIHRRKEEYLISSYGRELEGESWPVNPGTHWILPGEMQNDKSATQIWFMGTVVLLFCFLKMRVLDTSWARCTRNCTSKSKKGHLCQRKFSPMHLFNTKRLVWEIVDTGKDHINIFLKNKKKTSRA